jgi:hypothetical protein
MEHTIFEVIDSHERQEVSDVVPTVEIQKTLSAILLSRSFRSSKQSQLLLQYIVNQTLTGHVEMLKERIIGANLFHRRPDYDTNNDPIVRARAAEIRKRLALYYQAAHEEAILISVPSGSFKAIFEWTNRNSVEVPPVPHPGPESSQRSVDIETPPIPHEIARQELPPTSSRIRRRGWWVAIAAPVVLLAWAIQYYLASSEERAFNQFWSPILDNPHTTLIYVGGNAVYQLSSAYIDAYYQQHPRSQAEEMGFESYIPFPPGAKIDAQDLYPAKDTFVTIGDVAATTKIVSLLVHRNKQFDIRFGNDVAFGDLREHPTILIGAHNNSWTLTMTENLRYVFNGHEAIVDRSDPHKHWSTNVHEFTDDYAVVSRVLNSKTGTTVFTAAGIGHAGTRAAAEFLTNPQSISALVKSLPKDWEKKNLQIVLHTAVTNQLPGAPDVLATYCW